MTINPNTATTTPITERPPTPTPTSTPRKVTDGNPPASIGGSESAPGERETAEKDSSLQSDGPTLRDWTGEALQALRAYWVPPALLTEPPASLAELASYAKAGAWTSRRSGFLRGCGVWWYRLVALPVTAVCRYVEWTLQRPGRAVPVFALWKLLICTGAGPWAAEHVIRPVLGLLAWILL